MKVFWRGRDKTTPPLHAQFHLRSFCSQRKETFSPTFTNLADPATARVFKKKYLPDYPTWKKNVEKALTLIRKKELQKIVLGRTCILELDQEPDPFALTASLNDGGAFLFCLQGAEESFFGASPERLFCRNHRQILTESLAGTRRRGNHLEEDLLLKKELLLSQKDHSEMIPVQAYIQKNLSPFCSDPIVFSPLSIHETPTVQHLYSSAQATLNPSVGDEEILSSLHPTPALSGVPKEKAQALIAELEPFPRGLYGGIIGWSTLEHSEWIVAIRSCLLRGKKAILYSGTGIVEESDPEKEWEELEHKVKLFHRTFLMP